MLRGVRFDIKTSPEIHCRSQFGDLLNARGLLRNAVEVGTDRGAFAHELLSQWNGDCLFCIDNYEPCEFMTWDRKADMMLALGYLAQFAPRVRLIVSDSTAAVEHLDSYPVEFVYIDGSHDYASVTRDIRVWWEALEPNGILAGDDFDEEHDGVRKAVKDFAMEHDLTVYTTSEAHRPDSWYCYKTEPETLWIILTKKHGGDGGISID